MDQNLLRLDGLVQEYETLLAESARAPGSEQIDYNALESVLVGQGGWSACGARHLIALAKGYGTFVLRNALALAVAAGIEDGLHGL